MNNGKICVSVCAKTAVELVGQIKRAEDSAEVIEIRFDCLDKTEFEKIYQKIISFKKTYRGKILAAFRPAEQGGKSDVNLDERIDFWRSFSSFETSIEWADLELDLETARLGNLPFEKIIRSFHDFSGVPENLDEIYQKSANGEEISKIAVQADDVADSIPIWKLLEKATSENKQIIPIAMGEAGKWTRILGLAHGAFMTYAALDAGKETAPGQVSARDLIEVYRAKELNAETGIYGILGGNTSVSMSPYIHNAAFKFHDLNAVFVPLQVSDLDEFITRMVKPETREVELNFKGFSVTIPHKQSIIKHLDFIDDTAKSIGAVNTVKIAGGKLHGFNTDAKGFIEPLLNSYGDLQNAKVAILGAGGAARACVYALKNSGADVTIFARNLEKAQNLAEDFQVELEELPTTDNRQPTTEFNDFDILVNATPLGMRGKAEDETPARGERFERVKLVYDLIYVPFETRLMKEADRFNVPKIGGLAMLIAQAAEQQKIWTGKDAPVREMSRAALRRLQ